MRKSVLISMALVAFLILFTAASATAAGNEPGKVTAAIEVLERIMKIPQMSIPNSLFDDASAIAIIPSAISVEEGSGRAETRGTAREGVLVARTEGCSWSHPVFINLSGSDTAHPLETGSKEIVLVFRNGRGVDALKGGESTLRVDAVAGPVGRSSHLEFKEDVYAYALAEQSVSGIALAGVTMKTDENANANFYGPPGITPGVILAGKEGKVMPPAVSQLTCMIAGYSNAPQACS
jgi:lipid-binding SYLF domain-containing protein